MSGLVLDASAPCSASPPAAAPSHRRRSSTAARSGRASRAAPGPAATATSGRGARRCPWRSIPWDTSHALDGRPGKLRRSTRPMAPWPSRVGHRDGVRRGPPPCRVGTTGPPWRTSLVRHIVRPQTLRASGQNDGNGLFSGISFHFVRMHLAPIICRGASSDDKSCGICYDGLAPG
jgi:hypothetical protein